MDGVPPVRTLELFDQFDLDEMRERRLATYALEDYYGTTLSEISIEYLEFGHEAREHGIAAQWNKAKTRIQTLDTRSVDCDHNRIINQLSNIRNDVAHDYTQKPELETIGEAREIADEWADWFIESAKDYQNQQEELTAKEAMINLTQQSAKTAKGSPDDLDYSELVEKQEEINSDADWILDNMDILESTEGISKMLVHDLAEAMQLEQDAQKIRKENQNRLEYEAEQRLIHETSTRCLVIEPFSEEDPRISIATHEFHMDNLHFRVHPNDYSNETTSKLKNLEVDDEVFAYIATDRDGERYIKDFKF